MNSHNNFGNSSEFKKNFDEGVMLLQSNQFHKSNQVFDTLLNLYPHNSEVLHFKGILALHNNDLLLAIDFFSNAIKINPNNEYFFNNLGIAYKKIGNLHEAALNFEKAISIRNSFFEAINNNANTLQALGNTNQAIELYLKAIEYNPNFADSFFNLGNAYKDIKRLNEATEAYKNVLKINPNHFEALTALGSLMCELENFSASFNLLRKSIAINRDYEISHNNLGITYLKTRDYKKALFCFDYAIKLKPDFIDAHSNRGLVFLNSDNLTKAIECFEKVLLLDPQHADALNNYGNALLKLKKYDEALGYFDSAIKVCPDHYANFNKSFTLLLQGNYHEGWKYYEFRLNNKNFNNNSFPKQKLLNNINNLINKKILICHEQGLGDTLQFIRYAKLLRNTGAQVFAILPKELNFLISDSGLVDKVFTLDSSLPDFDFFIPVASLPFLFDTNISNIPFPDGYLTPDKKKEIAWANRLGEKKKLRIGLTWSSTSSFSEDENRSMPLSKLSSYLDFNNYEYICLQKTIKDGDKNLFNKLKKIKFFGTELSDFSDTAALAKCLDLVVSTCTSIPHLTGAMGIQTFLLAQFNADWRWLIDRADTPWYNSVKIYRQNQNKNWDPVLKQVFSDIPNIKKVY